ncbi:MAG: signal peptidase II [Lachnospiraceae bacterium]|nr:signal peptidase II [Lachnospiraceae bacterium]
MIYLLLAAAIFAVDFYTKTKIEITPQKDFPRQLAGGHVELQPLHNKGLAGGKLKNKPWAATLISGIAFVCCALYALTRFFRKGDMLEKTALAMICGGAAGNFFDRLGRGYVVDFISFPSAKLKQIKKYVYNLADLFIFLGGALLLIRELFRKD